MNKFSHILKILTQNKQCELHKQNIMKLDVKGRQMYLFFLLLMAYYFPGLYKVLTGLPVCTDARYLDWLLCHYPRKNDLKSMLAAVSRLRYKPVFNIIMPVSNESPSLTRQAINSVLRQVYPYWRLYIVSRHYTGPRPSAMHKMYCKYAVKDYRISLLKRTTNQQYTDVLNDALTISEGEYSFFLSQHDILAEHALYETALALNADPGIDMLYSDDDIIDIAGKISQPCFKADWSPDSFLSRMYLGRFVIFRHSLILQLGGLDNEHPKAHIYDLALRCSEQTGRIFHICTVLYHQRRDSITDSDIPVKNAQTAAAEKKALAAALERRNEPGIVQDIEGFPGYYRIRYKIASYKKVSIILPTRDQGDILETCLRSIFNKTGYPNFEVIIIDNGSTEERTKEVIQYWLSKEPKRCFCYPYRIPFNFSLICNFGVRQATGEYLLFLNDDTEVISGDWMHGLVEQAQRPGIGSAGALLFYPDDTVQHAGAIMGLGGVAAHGHRGFARNHPGYRGQIITMNNYLSVAASCSMCRKQVFEALGSFDRKLPGDYEDVDLNLKMIERGYRNVYLPHVKLYHHESKTRGRNYALKNPRLQQHSIRYLKKKWHKYIDRDPFYNPNLSKENENYAIKTQLISEINNQLVQMINKEIIPATKGLIHCSIDSCYIYNSMFHIKGWAMDIRGNNLSSLTVIYKRNEKMHAHLGKERSDVLAAYPRFGNAHSGFVLFLKMKKPPRITFNIRIRFITQNRQAKTVSLRLPMMQMFF